MDPIINNLANILNSDVTTHHAVPEAIAPLLVAGAAGAATQNTQPDVVLNMTSILGMTSNMFESYYYYDVSKLLTNMKLKLMNANVGKYDHSRLYREH